MLSLTETIIGFASIMLMLSLLVKSLTSLIKNQFDYYTDNLEHEVKILLKRALGAGWAATAPDYKAWAEKIDWKRYDESFFTKDNIQLVLSEIGVSPAVITAKAGTLDALLKVSVANVKYAFEQRMKNLSLAAGLALCLFANINALSMWKALYTDEQLRTSFSDSYARQALNAYAEETKQQDNPVKSSAQGTDMQAAPATPTGATNSKPGDPPPTEQDLEKQRLAFRDKVSKFLSDVNFGVGAFWREIGTSNNRWDLFSYEFFGSLLTGILVSIGAPYWHDLLQAISNLRSVKT